MSQEALCHVSHLGAVPSEGNRRLGSRELLKDHTGHITQPGPLSLKLGVDDKKYLNMGQQIELICPFVWVGLVV